MYMRTCVRVHAFHSHIPELYLPRSVVSTSDTAVAYVSASATAGEESRTVSMGYHIQCSYSSLPCTVMYALLSYTTWHICTYSPMDQWLV